MCLGHRPSMSLKYLNKVVLCFMSDNLAGKRCKINNEDQQSTFIGHEDIFSEHDVDTPPLGRLLDAKEAVCACAGTNIVFQKASKSTWHDLDANFPDLKTFNETT